MEFDDEGFAAALGVSAQEDQEGEILLVEELLKLRLYESERGERFTMGSQRAGAIDLSALQDKWVEIVVCIEAGARRCVQEFKAALFRWPRCGGRLFVSCKALCQQLGLEQFFGQQWRWAWAGVRRWGPCLLHGSHEHGGQGAAGRGCLERFASRYVFLRRKCANGRVQGVA